MGMGIVKKKEEQPTSKLGQCVGFRPQSTSSSRLELLLPFFTKQISRVAGGFELKPNNAVSHRTRVPERV